MGLLALLFSCSNNPQDKQVEKKEKTPIQTLAYAISDVGLWTWWTTDSTKSVQQLNLTEQCFLLRTQD